MEWAPHDCKKKAIYNGKEKRSISEEERSDWAKVTKGNFEETEKHKKVLIIQILATTETFHLKGKQKKAKKNFRDKGTLFSRELNKVLG